MTRNEAFDQWYDAFFGTVLGAEDAENRRGVKRIWNAALESAARKFAFDDDLLLSGDQIADKLRRMQATE